MLGDVPQNAFTNIISTYLNINILEVRDSLNIFDSIFLVAQMGLFIGIMGTVPGHELVHRKKNKFDMFMERLLKANAHEVKIVENFTDAGADNVSDDIVKYAEDTTTLLDKYIDELEIDLDKDRLKNTMRGLYNEAQDLEL